MAQTPMRTQKHRITTGSKRAERDAGRVGGDSVRGVKRGEEVREATDTEFFYFFYKIPGIRITN